eukprot:5633697-Pyramimonas_sp.AAC.1
MRRKLRSASDVAVPAWVPYRTTCPMLSADGLRSAAKSFSCGHGDELRLSSPSAYVLAGR